MAKMGNLLEKTIDPMTIMIRSNWSPDVSDSYENLYDFSIFLDRPPRILDGQFKKIEKSYKFS